MPPERSLQPTPQLIIGMGLVVLGVLLMLDRLRIVDAAIGLRFWPVAIVAAGASLAWRGRGSSFPGLVLMAIGTLLLVGSVMQVSVWGLLFPIVIIALGARLVLQTSRSVPVASRPNPTGTQLQAPVEPGSSNGWVSVLSVLGGAKRATNDRPFRGGDITSFMGGVQLDLRQATIEPGGEAVISVFAMMSAQELWVPPGWTVSLEASPILGEVEDKRLPSVDAAPRTAPAAPRLIVKGVIIMGGLTIKG